LKSEKLLLFMPNGLRTPFTGDQEEVFASTTTPLYLQEKPQPDDELSERSWGFFMKVLGSLCCAKSGYSSLEYSNFVVPTFKMVGKCL